MSIFIPRARATTGGPAANTCDTPRTITEKWLAATCAAGKPATEPSAIETTGISPIIAVATSNAGLAGIYVRPIASMERMSAPNPSISRTIGSWRSSAMRSADALFEGSPRPLGRALVVKSPPPTTTGRPSACAMPMTNEAGRKSSRLPSSAYSALPAMTPRSRNEPGSQNASMRSRTVSLPRSCCSWMRSGPPMRSAAARRRSSSSISGCQVNDDSSRARTGAFYAARDGRRVITARLYRWYENCYLSSG